MSRDVFCSWCGRLIPHTQHWGTTNFHDDYCRNQFHSMKRKITRKATRILTLYTELEELKRLYPQCVIKTEYKED